MAQAGCTLDKVCSTSSIAQYSATENPGKDKQGGHSMKALHTYAAEHFTGFSHWWGTDGLYAISAGCGLLQRLHGKAAASWSTLDRPP